MRLNNIHKYLRSELRVPGLGPCLIWQRSKRDGYGRTYIKELDVWKDVHQIIWFIEFGYWANQLNHICNQRDCAEISHLYKGTQVQNLLDRKLSGYKIPGKKITIEIADKIREEYKPWVITTVMLADKYGIDKSNISRIINRQIWNYSKSDAEV